MQDKGVTNQAAISDHTQQLLYYCRLGKLKCLWNKTGGAKCPASFFASGTLFLFPGCASTASLWCPQLGSVWGLAGCEREAAELASRLLHFVLTCLWLEHWRSEASWYRPGAPGEFLTVVQGWA